MARHTASTAHLIKVFDYTNEPQIILMESNLQQKIIAIAIDHPELSQGFFGAEVSDDQLARYRRNFVDLRYLFLIPRRKNLFVFDLVQKTEAGIPLTPIKRSSYVEENYLPGAGFFARDQSEPILLEDGSALATHSYYIDGSWDLPDFSSFYGKVTDLYYFFLSLKRFASPTTDIETRKKIKEAFTGHPLRGGSSYVNLYDALFAAQNVDDQLSVRRIQYASPGNVDINGRGDVFGDLSTALGHFTPNYDSIRAEYRELHRYLSKTKLLRADKDRFDKTSPIAKFILERCEHFAAALNITNLKLIYDMTDKNALSTAKILLSYSRRLEKYFLFFAEGRVSEEAPVTLAE